MGSCHSANNSSSGESITNENLEFFSVIWLDKTVNKPIQIQQQLRKIINYLKIFQNENECQEYLKSLSKNEYIIFIVNAQLGPEILPFVHHLQQIFSIYIYSSNKNLDQSWIDQFNKVRKLISRETKNECLDLD
jgi:hypothetical protein